MNVEERIKHLNFNNDKELIEFIKEMNSELYNGKDNEGNIIVFGIDKGVGIRVSTYQSNGWIRINEYTIEKDEEDNEYIERSELYDK